MKKLLLSVFILYTAYSILYPVPLVQATVCGENVPTSQEDLQAYINNCNSKLSELSGQKQTLASAISYLNTQIKITQAKISSTQVQLDKLNLEIADLSTRIESIDYSLSDLTKLFISRVRETYMRRGSDDVRLIAQSSGLNTILRNIEYAKRIRDHDRTLLINLEKSRLDVTTQKDIKELKQKEIETLKKKLNTDKAVLNSQIASKNQLLSQTKNDEAKYQQLKSSAQAQLAAFSTFITSQGGASILSGTTQTDSSWGTYYNQREDDWGSMVINGQFDCGSKSDEPCTMASIGCLVTSMAMVMSYYGKSVTPGNIASQSELFSFADFRQGNLNISGVNTNRIVVGYSRATLDAELAQGKPVIVGLYSSSKPHHFIVVKSKEGDDYFINDPFPGNGMNIKFTSRYPLSAILRVDRVTVN